MRAIILAGGLGTRLRPLTDTVPKPLVPIHDRTLTEHVLDVLRAAGVTSVCLSVSHMADQVQAYFGTGDQFGLPITYLREPEPMGTAGPLMLLQRAGHDFTEDFLVVNGDNLFALDHRAWLEVHQRNNATVTLALTPVDDVTTRGVVALDGERVTAFVEKPTAEEAPSNLVSSGYYIFSPRIFDYIDATAPKLMFERDVFPRIAQDGGLCGYIDQGQWFDTGTPERYAQVIAEWRGPRS